MDSGEFSPNEEIEKIIKLVRDRSLIAMRMSGNYTDKFNKLSAAQYLEKLRLLYFSRKCCDN
jgi:hypothetical protein